MESPFERERAQATKNAELWKGKAASGIAVVADSFHGTGCFSGLASFYFFRRFRLLSDHGMAVRVVHLEVLGSFIHAGITGDTLLIYVKLARNIIRILVILVGHALSRQTGLFVVKVGPILHYFFKRSKR